jgi:hypothetical protein
VPYVCPYMITCHFVVYFQSILNVRPDIRVASSLEQDAPANTGGAVTLERDVGSVWVQAEKDISRRRRSGELDKALCRGRNFSFAVNEGYADGRSRYT